MSSNAIIISGIEDSKLLNSITVEKVVGLDAYRYNEKEPLKFKYIFLPA
jgi:hypothetical protein